MPTQFEKVQYYYGESLHIAKINSSMPSDVKVWYKALAWRWKNQQPMPTLNKNANVSLFLYISLNSFMSMQDGPWVKSWNDPDYTSVRFIPILIFVYSRETLPFGKVRIRVADTLFKKDSRYKISWAYLCNRPSGQSSGFHLQFTQEWLWLGGVQTM